jgi:hypothetical protein
MHEFDHARALGKVPKDLPEGRTWQHPSALSISAALDAHVFHLDRPTVGALLRTKNEPREEALPFTSCFIDTDIHVGPFIVRGVSVYHVAPTIGADELRARKVVEAHGEEMVDVGEPTWTIAPRPHQVYPLFYDALYHVAAPKGEYAIVGHLNGPIARSTAGLVTISGGESSKDLRKEDRLVHATVTTLVMNWLDLLHDPDVRLVQTSTGPGSEKRFRREHPKIAPPKSVRRIILTGQLKQYIDAHSWTEPRAGGERHYSHRFWVRGYWRTLRSERYKAKRGARVWTPPHVKGEGVLVRKQYEQRDERATEAKA